MPRDQTRSNPSHSEIRAGDVAPTDLIDRVPIAIAMIDAAARIRWLNDAAIDLIGQPRAECIGRPFIDLFVDRASAEEILSAAGRADDVRDREAEIRTGRGTIRHVLVHANADRTNDGVQAIRVVLNDITHRKRLDDVRDALTKSTERMQTILRAIAEAVEPEEVFEAIVDRVVEALGASTGGLWVVRGHVATLVRSVGYPQAARKGVAVTAIDSDVRFPAIDVIRTQTPMWIRSKDDLLARYPKLAAIVSPGISYRIACLPLLVRGRVLGSIGVTFEEAPAIDDAEREFLTLVAGYGAQALERLRLLEVERSSRERAERAAARTALLIRASRVFVEAAPEPAPLLAALLDEVVTGYADAAVVELVDEDRLVLAAAHHHDRATQSALAAAFESSRPMGVGPAGRVAQSGTSILAPAVDPHVLAECPELAAFGDDNPARSAVFVPLAIVGNVIGTLTVIRQDGWPPFTMGDQQLLEELAERTAMAVQTRRLYQQNDDARLRAELLYDLARAVISATRVDEVYAASLDAIERALGTDRAAVLVSDAEGVMRFRAWRRLSEAYRAAVEGHNPWAATIAVPEAIVVRDTHADPSVQPFADVLAREGIRALAFIPLVAGTRLLGKFMVYYTEPRDLSDQDLELAHAIANHVAAAVARFTAVEELEKTVRFNELFTGVLGHDLRNPLGAIVTGAQLALLRDEGEVLVKPLSSIIRSGLRMGRMIDQLLDFTRLRMAGGIPLDPRPLDVLTVVRQVMGELQAAHPDGALQLERRGDPCGMWDEDRLGQVFSNLIGNALQHGGDDRAVQVDVDGSDPDTVLVRVHNRAVIRPDVMPKLFQPLAGGQRRSDGSQGLGLGLFITDQIVHAHGGSVSVASSEAHGTSFTVSLPRHPPAVAIRAVLSNPLPR